MNVPAFTSKVGYHVREQSVSWQHRPRTLIQSTGEPYEWNVFHTDIRTAVCNRAPVNKSDGVLPTNHYFKAAVLQGSSYHAMDDWHESKGDSSRWIAISEWPLGNPYHTPAVSVPSWMENQVIQLATQDLMDLRANILEDLGQARQSVSMLATIFRTIVNLFLMARKGQWGKLRKTFKSLGYRPEKKLANGWLMYYYGIKPLVSTFDAICSSNGPKLKTVTKKRKLSQGVNPGEFASTNGGSVTGSAEQRVMCGITATLNKDSSLSYWSSLGLTNDYLSDALVTAWALTPYSFVLDWILPVERFLRTRSFASGITALHSYVTRSQVADVSVRASWVPGISSWTPWGELPQGRVRSFMYQREVYYGIVPPSGLSLNISLTPTNLISAAALLIQRS